jgi:hypothetical protein
MSQASEGPKTFMQKLLDGVEKVGNKVPPSAVIFLVLSAIVGVLSHVFYLAGTSVSTEVIVPVANAVCDELKKVGVPASAIRFDKVNQRIPAPTQTGNLFVDLPGTRKGPRLLFITHLDTVPLCAGAGFINPYPGKLGVAVEGTLADLLLVDGNPLENIKLVADPGKNFLVIMKDGKIYKNLLR